MEAGEQDSDQKASQLVSRYDSKFLSIRYTVHPKGIPGEARGKSSNVAWSAAYYAKHWSTPEEAANELITVVDGTNGMYYDLYSFMMQ